MGDRHIVILGCTVCKNKNYYFQRGKKKELCWTGQFQKD
ncbi:MAG: 50S ribosomal protein L33 [Elusimicrobia bacterium]|nr:50S ribosomal protein L33 [Elusimicrobiota bacterium]